jgi:hypothetical protein
MKEKKHTHKERMCLLLSPRSQSIGHACVDPYMLGGAVEAWNKFRKEKHVTQRIQTQI